MTGKKAKAKTRKAQQPEKPPKEVTYHRTQVPLDATRHPNIKLKSAGDKGMGIFAKHDLKAGATILDEDALFTIRKPMHEILKSGCDVKNEYNKLNSEQRRIFNNMRVSDQHEYDCANGTLIGSAIFVKTQSPTVSVYEVVPWINHACRPNAYQVQDAKRVIIKLIRDVEKDEEITIPYLEEICLLTSAQRKSLMKKGGYGFAECKCDLCLLPAKKRLVSDMRRHLLRNVLYVLMGRDLPHGIKRMKTFPIPRQDSSVYLSLLRELSKAEGVRLPFKFEFLLTGVHTPGHSATPNLTNICRGFFKTVFPEMTGFELYFN